MAQKWKLIHIKSKQRGEDNQSPKLPTSEQLAFGEIAINYGDGIETIAIRNENDEIVKFVSEKKMHEYVDKAIEEALPEIIKELENKIGTIFSQGKSGTNSIDSGEY
jgi:ERCC4-related helicase